MSQLYNLHGEHMASVCGDGLSYYRSSPVWSGVNRPLLVVGNINVLLGYVSTPMVPVSQAFKLRDYLQEVRTMSCYLHRYYYNLTPVLSEVSFNLFLNILVLRYLFYTACGRFATYSIDEAVTFSHTSTRKVQKHSSLV